MVVLFVSIIYTWMRHNIEAKQDTQNPDYSVAPRVEALGNLLLSLMDQQPILALALLIGAYVKSSPTSAYHLRMVQYLINLNTVSYIVTLGYCARQIRMPWYRIFTFIILIIVWIVPSALSTWSQGNGIRTELGCFKGPVSVPGEEFFSEPQIGLVVIVFMIITIIVAVARSFRAKVEAAQKEKKRNNNNNNPDASASARFGARCTEGCYLVGKAMFYFYLFAIGLSFIISNIKAMSELRKRFSPWTGDVENEWGYGQVLALALVLMPALEYAAACFREFLPRVKILKTVSRIANQG